MAIVDPDVSIGIVTLGGQVEPQEQWTIQARQNIIDALKNYEFSRNGQSSFLEIHSSDEIDTDTLSELAKLHSVVGQAIFTHKYGVETLPTKKNKFDWTLGEAATRLGKNQDFDYALFLNARNTFSSGARKTLRVAGLLTCAVGICVGVSGGSQIAFASLVDLRTGDITWFNVLASTVGDIREPEGAQKMLERLFESMTENAS